MNTVHFQFLRQNWCLDQAGYRFDLSGFNFQDCLNWRSHPSCFPILQISWNPFHLLFLRVSDCVSLLNGEPSRNIRLEKCSLIGGSRLHKLAWKKSWLYFWTLKFVSFSWSFRRVSAGLLWPSILLLWWQLADFAFLDRFRPKWMKCQAHLNARGGFPPQR